MKQIFPFLFVAIFLLGGCQTSGGAIKSSGKAVVTQGPQELATPQDYQGPEEVGGLGPYAQRENVGFIPNAGIAGNANIPPVKVAILLPLSGSSEALGQSMLQAAQLALFDLGASTFELLPRDTKGTAEGARQAAQDAINNGAQLILGPLFSSSVRAAKPVAARANVNMVAFSTDWTLAGGNTHLMGFMPFTQIDRIINHAGVQGLTNVALITTADTYGQAVERTIKNSARQNSVAVSQIIRLAPNNIFAFSGPQITAIRNARPQAVLIAVGGQGAKYISEALNNAGLNENVLQRLGTGLWDDPSLAVEPSLSGGLFAAPSPSVRQKFEQNYANLYGTTPPRLASLAYDATALAAVLGKMGQINERSGIYEPAYGRNALQNPAGFSGIDGVFRFNRGGLVQRGLAVLEFQGGRIIEVDPAPRRF